MNQSFCKKVLASCSIVSLGIANAFQDGAAIDAKLPLLVYRVTDCQTIHPCQQLLLFGIYLTLPFQMLGYVQTSEYTTLGREISDIYDTYLKSGVTIKQQILN